MISIPCEAICIVPESEKKPLEIEWICLNDRGYLHSFYARRQYGPDGIAETACPICGAEAMPREDKELMEDDWRQVF